ncbi:tubulin-dependent ATPase kip3 [Batrachochytrium dendrobatidis]
MVMDRGIEAESAAASTGNSTESSAPSSSITVLVRVRPLLSGESGSNSSVSAEHSKKSSFLSDIIGEPSQTHARIITVLDEHTLIFGASKNPNANSAAQRRYTHHSRRNKEYRYSFDRVLDEQTSQQQLFEVSSKPLIDYVLDGYNATVFAYGATGCGKTHTITGSQSDPGIIPKTVQELFSRLKTLESDMNYTTDASISYLEVYNETIKDLLSPGPPLDLREDNSRVIVAGLSEHTPATINQVMDLLLRGNEHRTKAPTLANAVSSRSHAVLQIHLRYRDKSPSGVATVKVSTLSIIDLAGSERASVTKNTGDRLLEGANINRSLLSLGNCINALCSDRPNHIPYRDSKLTRLLKFSLGGNCKVVMIANISPATIHYEETHNTLKYANRAKNIKTKLVQNTLEINAHIGQYPKIIEALRAELALLRSSQSLAPISNSIQSPLHGTSTVSNDRVYVRLIKKADDLVAKFESIQTSMTTFETRMACNESLMKIFKSLAFSLSKIFQLPTRYISCVMDRIDQLHSENAMLWHNIDQSKNACERYITSLEELHNHRRLQSPLLRERLTLDVSTRLTQVQLRLVACQRAVFEESNKTISDLLFRIMQLNTDIMTSVFDMSGVANSTAFLQHIDAFISAESLIDKTADATTLNSNDLGLTTNAIQLVEYESCTEDNESICSDTSSIFDQSTSSIFEHNQEYEEDTAFDLQAPLLDQLFSSVKDSSTIETGSKLFLPPLQDMDSDMHRMQLASAKLIQDTDDEASCHHRSADTTDEGDDANSIDPVLTTPLPLSVLRVRSQQLKTYTESDHDRDATPMAKHRIRHHNMTEKPANQICTPSTVKLGGDISVSVNKEKAQSDCLNPDSIRITPIRREHRRKMRQSLIPILRPAAPRLVPENKPMQHLSDHNDGSTQSLIVSTAAAEMVVQTLGDLVGSGSIQPDNHKMAGKENLTLNKPLKKRASPNDASTTSSLRVSRRKHLK